MCRGILNRQGPWRIDKGEDNDGEEKEREYIPTAGEEERR